MRNFPAKTEADLFVDAILRYARKGDDEAALALIAQSKDPNAIARFGKTALDAVAFYDRVAVVRALLQVGADPNLSNGWKATPLMRAKSVEATRLLLEAGAEVNAKTIESRGGLPTGETALMYAAGRGDLESVKLLLAHGANTEAKDSRDGTPMLRAIYHGHHQIIQLLREAGATIGMIEAATLGETTFLRKLLQVGGDLHREDIATALRFAAMIGKTESVAMLLDYRAEIEAEDQRGHTALVCAAWTGRIETMRLLIKRGAEGDGRSGATALSYLLQFAKERVLEGVRLLIENGVALEAKNWSPLMIASMKGNVEVVEYLLQRGANPNHFSDAEEQAIEGCVTNNALMCAITNKRFEVVKLLLKYGADVDLKSNNGDSAVGLAGNTERHHFPERMTDEQCKEMDALIRKASKLEH